ncbi:mannose-1-phosphate guanylyltransferase/mannose-6-phosphate isomerase [Salmonella enterica subsp. enterica serovar Gaminara]|nr:mannose-1-phosphate guanylyltransferase/mannose-6-phosphate isomerase [Salmonella enterica subsp. enterica serovar Gaminara]
MSNVILPVVMAGGAGSRLWPLSRALYPKQFLSLTSTNSMLQETIIRLEGIEHEYPLFICNEEHRFIVAEQLRQLSIDHSGIILEPDGRNTGPAIALAAFHALNNGYDPVMLVLAADHEIQERKNFIDSIEIAKQFAENDKLVTFGIVPASPETGYGYIKVGEKIGPDGYKVAAFVEKPHRLLAEEYINSGKYLWNSGMFMFKASVFLNELKKFRPDIYSICETSLLKSESDLDFIRVNGKVFNCCPSESIDYAVMENTMQAVVVPLDAKWSDVGSWTALWDISKKNENGNIIRGDVIAKDTDNCYLHSESRLIGTVGVKDLVIVETKDAVLVAHKNNVQDVKNIVEQLKIQNRQEYLHHREVYRPWGSHDAVADGERFRVKHVTVLPGHAISKQVHYHRAEHWVIVSGTARVYIGDENFLLGENESTFIPVGTVHSIENPGKIPLEIIEVQSGTYLHEDDVERS